MSTFWNWIKSFFTPGNVKTSLAGVATLAGTAAACYGMSTGAVPITPGTISQAAAGAAAGIGLLNAKDASSTTTVEKAVQGTIGALQNVSTTAASIDPLYKPIMDSIEQAGQQASTTAKIAAVAQAAQAIAATIPSSPAQQ